MHKARTKHMNAKHELTKTIFAPSHIYLEEIFKAAGREWWRDLETRLRQTLNSKLQTSICSTRSSVFIVVYSSRSTQNYGDTLIVKQWEIIIK